MARKILFASQKGGVGKSTLARSTAVALAHAGRRILLADFDVEQGTCLRWHEQRLARRLEPPIEVAKFSKEWKFDQASRDYDDVVMDTRGHHDKLPFDLAATADVIFLPTSFSLDDVSPTLKMVE
jgi:chromosome partitioning protein